MDGASFYWHLGDLRAIYDFDQDMVQATKMDPKMAGKHLTIIDYEKNAWDDFSANQIAPFENIPMPFYLGIGNHETIPPKNRCQFSKQFARLLEKPELHNSKTDSVSGTLGAAKPANAKNSKSDAAEATQSMRSRNVYGNAWTAARATQGLIITGPKMAWTSSTSTTPRMNSLTGTS